MMRRWSMIDANVAAPAAAIMPVIARRDHEFHERHPALSPARVIVVVIGAWRTAACGIAYVRTVYEPPASRS